MYNHKEICDMLEVSLKELIITVDKCIKFKKSEQNWFDIAKGCLGYPASILLLTVVDTIGSVFEGVLDFKVKIDGNLKTITHNSYEHFYIFNSQFYGREFTEDIIKEIYESYRCLLVHNSSLLVGCTLDIGTIDSIPIEIIDDIKGDAYPFRINLRAFHKLSARAVDLFLQHAWVNEDQIMRGRLAEKLNKEFKLPPSYMDFCDTTTGTVQSVTSVLCESTDNTGTKKRKYFVEFEFKTPDNNYYWFPLFVNAENISEANKYAKAVETALQEHYEVRNKSVPSLYIEGMSSDFISKYIKQRSITKLQYLFMDAWRFEDIKKSIGFEQGVALEVTQSNDKDHDNQIIAKLAEHHKFPVRLIHASDLGAIDEFLLINVVIPSK